jgi:hypothetical protein
MSTSTDISVLYREFTESLTEVLAETAGTPVRRGRLARPHAAVKKHYKTVHHLFRLGAAMRFCVVVLTDVANELRDNV